MVDDNAGLGDVPAGEGPPYGLAVEEPPRRRFEWWWLIAGTVAVLAVAIAGVAAVAAIRGSFGDRMATATALPPDTGLYISMDLEGLARFDRLITTFETVAERAGMEPDADVLDFLDEMMLAELGLSTADFEPWIGRDVGVAILDFDPSMLAAIDAPPVIVAASVRDEAEADAFMPKMVDAMERQGMAVSSDSYGEVALWVAEPAADTFGVSVPVVMGRSGDMMLMASGPAAMRRAIDAQAGDTLRDAEDFAALVDELPGDRAVTLYLGPEVFGPLADLFSDPQLGVPSEQAAQVQETLDSFRGLAMALTIDDAGMRLDAVQAFEPSDDFTVGAQSGSERIPAALPADTFAYFGIGPWDVQAAWQQVLDSLETAGMVGDVAEFEAETGLDVERDVVSVLTGELGFGLFPATTGLFADLGDVPLGGMLLLGITDADAARATLERFNRTIEELGAPVEEQDGLFRLSPDGVNDVVYGVVDDLVVVASGADAARQVGEGGDRLVDAAPWDETREAIGGEGPPLLYVDVGRALDTFDAPPDVADPLAPLRALAAAAETSDGLTKATFMAIIDWADE